MNLHVNKAEEVGFRLIERSFKHVFPAARILHNVILPMDDENSLIETAEYDTIVVCRAGVFLFEVKGYEHTHITFHTDNGKKLWRLNSSNGKYTDVNDPLPSTFAKRSYLANSLDCIVNHFVLLPFKTATIDPAIPSNVLLPNDLPFVARMVRTNAKYKDKYLDDATVYAISDSIEELSSNFTLEEHIENCRRYKARLCAATT